MEEYSFDFNSFDDYKKARQAKWLAEKSRKEQDPERRCQASRQNSVVDSGLGGRGGRESTIRSVRSELPGSGPPSRERDDSGEESFDGNDSADETLSGILERNGTFDYTDLGWSKFRRGGSETSLARHLARTVS